MNYRINKNRWIAGLMSVFMLAGCSSAQSADTAGTNASSQGATVSSGEAAQEAAYKTESPSEAEVDIIITEEEDIFTRVLVSKTEQYLLSNQFAKKISTQWKRRPRKFPSR